MGLFTPLNSGSGVSLACTVASGRVALPSAISSADAMRLTNMGAFFICVRLGDSSVTATTQDLPIPPGEQRDISIPFARGSGAPTYVAGITASDTATLQITLGNQT